MEDSISQLVFDQAFRSAEIIQKTFGKNCEVVVHDFSNLESTLVHMSGNLTKRKIGSPPTDLILKEIQKNSADIEDIHSYLTESREGILMKSATIFLRKLNGEVIGALCINFNINALTQLTYELQDFLQIEGNNRAENFFDNVHEVIEEMTRKVIREFNKPTGLLTKEEKIEVVSRLEEKGAFMIKGATEYLAEILGVSKFTVYNYLQSVRVKNDYYKNNYYEKEVTKND